MKRSWIIIFVVTLVIFIFLDIFLAHAGGHKTFPWSSLAGFFSLFGLIGCLLLIAGAKLLGHYWLQRGEDYYDKNDDNE